MGGAIALKFALDSPQRVKKLVLVSAMGLGQEVVLANRLLAAIPALVYFSRPTHFGAKLVLQGNVYDPESIPKAFFELNYKLFKVPGRKEALISLLKTNINIWGVKTKVTKPIIQNLDRIQSKTLIIWGREDTVFPVAHAQIAMKKIPHAQLQIFEKCGHWAQVEYSEKFNQLVLKFLEEY